MGNECGRRINNNIICLFRNNKIKGMAMRIRVFIVFNRISAFTF